ncbi:MAG: dihydrolipoyllysine-residue acetyltransferase [Oceanicoccus sp.]
MSIELIKVPDIGGTEGVEVIEICVAVGDQVELEQSLVVLESDKASMEVPSPIAGTVTSIKISDGDELSEGDVILELDTGPVLDDVDIDAVRSEVLLESESESESESEAEPAIDFSISEKTTTPSPSAVDQSFEPKIEMISVPDMGDAENVDVIEVCVNIGDEVAEGDSLIVLETDKASMEVPSPVAGKVVSLAIQEGATASAGMEILQLELAKTPITATEVESSANSLDESVEAPVKSEPITTTQPAPMSADVIVNSSSSGEKFLNSDSVYAGPAVRRLAREIGLDITLVEGTGPRGRIVKDDLKLYIKKALTATPTTTATSGIPRIPDIDFGQFGDVKLESLSKIHRATAQNMHRSWLNVPHVTQFDDADISDLEEFRKSLKAEAEQRGVKITPLPFLLKACAAALRENPKFNASLHTDGQQLVYKQYVNIGIAVDTPLGLVVPVIRDVDKKSIWELAAETIRLAQKAKDRKLKIDDMQGGCFTISSLGSIGGQGFTPIVNTPEVAILGVSKLSVKPLWNGSEFVPAKMLPLSLSYDHRAINGGDAGRFLTYLTAVLADIRRLAL